MEEFIVTEKLTKKYGDVTAIDGLDLKVHAGEIYGFLGPNGAGKTTTIRVLTTLTKPTSGRALVNGFDVVKEPDAVKKMIGVVQQHVSLDRDLTVKENMEFRARLHHLGSSERKKRIGELLDYVGLTEEADRLVDDLSGGMKKRAMIVSSLMHSPKVLFLDEPTVGLDAQTRRRLWDLIRRLHLDGTTVFLTTHYIEEAEALCQRVGIIDQGRLIDLGKPLELRQRLGLVTVETLVNNKETRYQYFADRAAATSYVQNLPPEAKTVIIRESNLEDVFVELTGRKVGAD
ncbi:ABC transporter ATP-binding protein [Candidatus Bathyarchaeota archaeon]|nr:ABC transporter ATP-binding protein [Candidatus Bathyarchaeota archaeon]